MKKIVVAPGSFFKILAGTARSQVAEMVLQAGQATGGPTNRHTDTDQWLYVVQGTGQAVVDGKKVNLKMGELLLIEAGENHEIINSGKTPLKTLNFYSSPEF